MDLDQLRSIGILHFHRIRGVVAIPGGRHMRPRIIFVRPVDPGIRRRAGHNLGHAEFILARSSLVRRFFQIVEDHRVRTLNLLDPGMVA